MKKNKYLVLLLSYLIINNNSFLLSDDNSKTTSPSPVEKNNNTNEKETEQKKSNESPKKTPEKETVEKTPQSAQKNAQEEKTISPTPEQKVSQKIVLTSVYIQNNSEKDAQLKEIDLLISNKTEPYKKNLKITIPGNKNSYKSKGSVTAFDLSTEDSIDKFNGISSITIDEDIINFPSTQAGFSLTQPIVITKKNDHWVLEA